MTGDPAQSTAPPGWYTDPWALAARRYWDGGQWTGHVDGEGAAAHADPSAGQPAAPSAPHQHGGFAAPSPYGHYPSAAAWAAQAESSARQWAMFAHLSALLALLIGLPFIGPLVIYLVKKDADPFVAEHAREALNFNISVFIYSIVSFVVVFALTIVLIGFLLIPLLFGIGIAWLVLLIVAAVKANAGERYRYPLTIRMVS